MMDVDKDCASAERKEIAARVATFKETQEKFRRERAEYFAATLNNAGHSRSTHRLV